MPARTMTAQRAVLRQLLMAAAAVSLAIGLGSVVPAPRAVAETTRAAGSPGSGTPVTA